MRLKVKEKFSVEVEQTQNYLDHESVESQKG